ncbi:coiled-coil domain-containing protein 71 isoform X3 [Eublepharis macularius]|uniref:Coiled-coil domain-containing protein 71 isoform X3 n=1 Tax=Eublepharis macularius TaxID=481883 RepID=A0AA97KVD7_EUBMA|nr:coiled-coil domain-containing protein 71 isoform X3 [Eublepharis macularius]
MDKPKSTRRWVDPKRHGHWNLQNNQEKEVAGRPLPDYQQHLYRLLGPEKASRILNPPILEQPISPPVQRLLVAGKDMGAEDLWRALHEEPKQRRQLAESKKGRSLSHQVPWLGRPVSTPRMQQVAHWQQKLYAMHHLGKQNQRTTSFLLATKHFTDLSDPYGTEGPARYLHYPPDN